jgi:N-acetylglucosamine transport system substrate-binding protein
MSDERVKQIVQQYVNMRQNRRSMLGKAAAFGTVPALAGMARPFGAFAQATPMAGMSEPTTASGATNPLGVDPAAPLDVVIFKGGYGDDYAINVNDNLYSVLYPEAEITYAGIQRLGEQLQPRFVDGNPPDIIDNSGAGNLDNAALIADEQLADLADLMGAVSFDTPDTTFADTLLAGSQDTGVYDGKQFLLNYVVSVTGIWYSSSWMAGKGYTYPKTWTEMMDLCEEIKGSGISPWLTTGVHPQYILGFVFNQMLWKHDPQAIINIDNLEADAWKAPAVKEVLEALYMLADRDYIGAGWEGLDHTQSQAEWLQGKAIFLPCGSWLENEMAGLIPDGFDMVVAQTPSLDGDVIPFEGIFAGAGEPFIVPSQGKNVQGGKEWLRLLFSKAGGKAFSELTKNLSVVNGAADDVEFGIPTASVQSALQAAGSNVFESRYGSWYKDLQDTAKLEMASLLQKGSSIDDFMNNVQDAADMVKDDDAIVKYTR